MLVLMNRARWLRDDAVSELDEWRPAERPPTHSTEALAPAGLLGPDGEALSLTKDTAAPLVIRVREFSDELLAEFGRTPEAMHSLDGHRFEHLVGELLERQGFEVTVVSPGPDSGVDIYAARSDSVGSFLYLVQCKRWQPTRKVHLGVVQRLYGNVATDNATAGLVVTTSQFTGPAVDYQQRVPHRMSLHDYDKLKVWLSLRRVSA